MSEDGDKNEDTADPDPTQGGADTPQTCATCGSQIDIDDWHPMVTEWDDDGTLRVYAFCDQDCKEDWAEDRNLDG